MALLKDFSGEHLKWAEALLSSVAPWPQEQWTGLYRGELCWLNSTKESSTLPRVSKTLVMVCLPQRVMGCCPNGSQLLIVHENGMLCMNEGEGEGKRGERCCGCCVPWVSVLSEKLVGMPEATRNILSQVWRDEGLLASHCCAAGCPSSVVFHRVVARNS